MSVFNIKIQLPSRGRYGVSHVKICKPVVRVLRDYLTSPTSNIVAKNAFIKEVCDTDLMEYPVGDREHIFATIRSLIGGNIIEGVVDCDCGEKIIYWFDIAKAKVRQLPDDFQKDYELVFPVCKEKKILNLLTVRKEELLEEYVELYEGSDNKMMHSELEKDLYEYARYACMFSDSVDLETIDKNIEFILNLDWNDFEVLLMYDLSFGVGPELWTRQQCDACKRRYKIIMKTDATFFGLNFSAMLHKHRFLARTSNIGFEDFLHYTLEEMDGVYDAEVLRVKDKNSKIRSARVKRKKH